MDRICSALLSKLHALSPTGRYVIIDGDDLFDVFPDGGEKSYSELNKSLNSLCKEGYIDVKYSRGETYCIAPLKRYEEVPEVEVYDADEGRKRLDPVFISAFAGGALGSLIISLIFAFI